jgi:hypothetical protein
METYGSREVQRHTSFMSALYYMELKCQLHAPADMGKSLTDLPVV